MGGSNQPSKWWMPKDSNFGVPQPQYVIPAAYINKQAAEWPQGRYLPPCIIPPPTVTYAAGFLTVNGASVYVPATGMVERAEFMVTVPVGGNGDSGVDKFITSIPEVEIPLTFRGQFTNYGVDAITNSVIKLVSAENANLVGATCTITVAGTTVHTCAFAQLAAGFVIPNIPAGAGVLVVVTLATSSPHTNPFGYNYTCETRIAIRGGPNSVEFNLTDNLLALGCYVQVTS